MYKCLSLSNEQFQSTGAPVELLYEFISICDCFLAILLMCPKVSVAHLRTGLTLELSLPEWRDLPNGLQYLQYWETSLELAQLAQSPAAFCALL